MPRDPRTGRFVTTTGDARRSNLANALEFGQTTLVSGAALTIQGVASEAVQQIGEDMQEAVELFAASLANSTRRNQDRRLIDLHRDAAQVGQRAMVRAYERSHPSRVAAPSNPSRDAGGRLLSALQSEDFYLAQYDGIGFGNIRLLDSRARQWYRLNFGAGRRGTRAARSRPRGQELRLFGEAVLRIGLGDNPVSQGNLIMPPGFFYGTSVQIGSRGPGRRGQSVASRTENGAQTFAPSESRRGRDFFVPVFRPNKDVRANPNFFPGRKDPPGNNGIAGSYFMDKGLSATTRELSDRYPRLIDFWFEEAVEKSRGPVFKAAEKRGTTPQLAGLQQVVRNRFDTAREAIRRVGF